MAEGRGTEYGESRISNFRSREILGTASFFRVVRVLRVRFELPKRGFQLEIGGSVGQMYTIRAAVGDGKSQISRFQISEQEQLSQASDGPRARTVNG